MTREEFLEEIAENLHGKMTTNEITDILNDYNEYFDAGMREGKTEEEICSEWGSPARIVKTLLAEGQVNSSIDRVSVKHIPNSGHSLEKYELHFAPLPNRIIAFIIDALIASLPIALLTRAFFAFFIMPFMPVVILSMATVTAYTSSPNLQSERIYGTLALAFYVLYPIISLLLLKGQTVGKLVMKIKVVRQDGSPLRLTDILARETLGKLFVNGISFGIASLVSFIWSLVSNQHKTVHDVIGGTRVVNILESCKQESDNGYSI